MIDRYTRPAMGALWTDHARMEAWRAVEVAACEEMDGPTARTSRRSAPRRSPSHDVQEREAVTDHDVAAFVDVLSASAGPSGRWIHYGLTSSDVLDTALAVQLRLAGEIVLAGAQELVDALVAQARAHVDTRLRRPHPRRARRADDLRHQARRLRDRGARATATACARAFDEVAFGAISGAVGTYSATDPDFERRVLRRLDLQAEPVSTQVVPRDRHAQLLQAVALAGAGLERLATEIRHLQRTEVLEAREPFRSGQQKGSSAMPHKRNPITTERITGPRARPARQRPGRDRERRALARARHQPLGRRARDPPRLADPLDYLQHLAIRVVSGLVVDADRMRANLDLTHGALFSQRVLLALVAQGLHARRGLPDRPGVGAGGVGHRDAAARPARRARPRASTSTRSSTWRTTRATRTRSSAGSTPSPR